jgi:polar amino acid transport system substrate-binding protein
MREGEEYEGLVLDLWQRIALENDLAYELVLQTDTQEALEAVMSGELDLLVGPFSITSERLQTVDFTQPFFVSSVGVLLPSELPSLWSRVRPFFTRAALSSVGVLLVCLFLVGNAMWLAERKQNPEHFSRQYLPGIGNGMWFALVTLTTVGYGDRAPMTPAGRFVASIWMLISLIAVSSLIGGLASAFTLALSKIPTDGITSPEDLQGTRMAVVAGSSAAVWATEYQARVLAQPKLEDAVALVLAGRADGVVFDLPALEYYLAQNPDLDLQVADFVLSSENFGFVVPHDSPLTQQLDLTIVQLKEEGVIQDIKAFWLEGIGSSGTHPAETSLRPNLNSKTPNQNRHLVGANGRLPLLEYRFTTRAATVPGASGSSRPSAGQRLPQSGAQSRSGRRY